MRAWNLAQAVARFIRRPGFVGRDEYAARLAACEPCDKRAGGKCTACDCWVQLKARLKTEDCPLHNWF